jgi:hypothetical protein
MPAASLLAASVLASPFTFAAPPSDGPAPSDAIARPDDAAAAPATAAPATEAGPETAEPAAEPETAEPAAEPETAEPAHETTTADEGTEPAHEPHGAPHESHEPDVSGSAEALPAESSSVANGMELVHPDRFTPRVLLGVESNRTGETKHIRNDEGNVTFIPGLQARNQVFYVSPFQIDRVGSRYEEGAQSTGRMRWSPTLRLGKKQNVEINTQFDFANGRWAPQTLESAVLQEIVDGPDSVAVGLPPGRQTLRTVDARHLYVTYTSPIGQLRIGQMGFTWGQGILANDGNNADRFGDLRFGDDGPGDIYERILFGTRPLKPLGGKASALLVAIGGDLVFRDERINVLEGDLGAQALFVLRWQPEDNPGNWIGGYAVYRWQKSADDGDVYPNDGRLEVGVGDFAGQGTLDLKGKLSLIGGFESVLIGGNTGAAYNENFTVDENGRGGHKILQGAAVGRGYIGNHEKWLVGFDAGYASGDENPDDGQINNFTMDAGHTVGLLMFQQVQGWSTARSEVLATDGELTGEAPNGSQFIPTRGAATNVVYVHPKARYAFKELVEVWGGPLFAFAPVGITDPYTTRLGGGTPTNSLGGDGAKQFYGTELDLGVRARYALKDLWLQAGIQGAVLFKGAGLADAAGDTGAPVGGIWFRTEVRY